MKMENENWKTNELGFQELAAMSLEGEFGSLQIFSIGRMPNDRNLA
jgi:hypothetical protein